MGDFKRSGKKSFSRDSRGSGRSFSRGGDSGGRFARSDGTLTEVTCDKCGRTCQVPFKPSGNKPVYCKDCFKKDDDSGNRFVTKRGNSISAEDFDQINEKLDKIMRALNVE